MAQRLTPENFFKARANVQTQEPIPVTQQLQTDSVVIDLNLVVILGIVAIVGLIGLFALLGHESKCGK